MQIEQRDRIVFLDYMRIFAFMSVIVGHEFFGYIVAVSTNMSYHITLRQLAGFFIPLTAGGAGGVVVFFCCSGYIITHVLQRESSLDFLVKRIFRIYPLYIFAVILEIAFSYIVHGTPAPPLTTLIPRITLTGDFFNTPSALGGVEWTLRIEVLFYALMLILKATRLFEYQLYLPAYFTIFLVIIFLLPAFPNFAVWSDGYFNIYFPFLLIGSIFYLMEQKTITKTMGTAFTIVAITASCLLIMKFQPSWKESNYAIYSFGIFYCAWLCRRYLQDGFIIKSLANLTYSAYLFHGWLWQYLTSLLAPTGLRDLTMNLAILLLLILICLAMHNTVEIYGIKMGSKIIKAYKARFSLLGAATNKNQELTTVR